MGETMIAATVGLSLGMFIMWRYMLRAYDQEHAFAVELEETLFKVEDLLREAENVMVDEWGWIDEDERHTERFPE